MNKNTIIGAVVVIALLGFGAWYATSMNKTGDVQIISAPESSMEKTPEQINAEEDAAANSEVNASSEATPEESQAASEAAAINAAEDAAGGIEGESASAQNTDQAASEAAAINAAEDAAQEQPQEEVSREVSFDVSGGNFYYDLKEIRVNEGDTVTINFLSESGFHDWVVDEFNAATAQVSTGGETSVTFVADKKGTFEYYCSVGSHRAQGMVGNLIVE